MAYSCVAKTEKTSVNNSIQAIMQHYVSLFPKLIQDYQLMGKPLNFNVNLYSKSNTNIGKVFLYSADIQDKEGLCKQMEFEITVIEDEFVEDKEKNNRRKK